MIRSSLVARAGARGAREGWLLWALDFGLGTPTLTTSSSVPSRDEEPEDDLQSSEARGEVGRSPGLRRTERGGAQQHEERAHDRDDADRVGAPRHDRGAIEEQPDAWQELDVPGAFEGEGQERPGGHRRRESQEEPPRRSREERRLPPAGLANRCVE